MKLLKGGEAKKFTALVGLGVGEILPLKGRVGGGILFGIVLISSILIGALRVFTWSLGFV